MLIYLTVLWVANIASMFYFAKQVWGLNGAIAFMNLAAVIIVWITILKGA